MPGPYDPQNHSAHRAETNRREPTVKTFPLIAALVAAVMTMTTATAMAAPCHPPRRCSPPPPVVVTVVDMTESSKIRLVRVEEAVDAQNGTINALVGSHNDLVGRVGQDRAASHARDAALRRDLDSEIEEREAVDAETADLLLEGIEVDGELEAKAEEAEARATEAREKAERLERELRALKDKKEKK